MDPGIPHARLQIYVQEDFLCIQNLLVFQPVVLKQKKKPLAAEGENNAVRYNSGLAVVNPQQGHIILKDSPEVHTCMYI